MLNLKATRRAIMTGAALAKLKQAQTEKFGGFIDAFVDDRSAGLSSFRVFLFSSSSYITPIM